MQLARLAGRFLAAGLCTHADVQCAKVLMETRAGEEAGRWHYWQLMPVPGTSDITSYHTLLAHFAYVTPALELSAHVSRLSCLPLAPAAAVDLTAPFAVRADERSRCAGSSAVREGGQQAGGDVGQLRCAAACQGRWHAGGRQGRPRAAAACHLQASGRPQQHSLLLPSARLTKGL